MLVGAIDIGSNGVRLLLGEEEPLGELHFYFRKRAAVRFGADAFSKGEFGKKTFEDAFELFSDFTQILKDEGIEKVICVATSAFRDSKNSKILAREILKKFNIHINIISGILESDLIFKGVQGMLETENSYNLLIDIGGGSTELKLCRGNHILKTLSLDLGTVRFMKSDNHFSSKDDQEALEFLRSNFQYEIAPYLRSVDSDQLQIIGTGGNLRRLGKLKRKLLGKYDTMYLKKKHFKVIYQRLLESTYEERVKEFGLRADRAETILPASHILKTCLDDLNWYKVYLPNVGLAHGVLKALVQGDHKLVVSYLK